MHKVAQRVFVMLHSGDKDEHLIKLWHVIAYNSVRRPDRLQDVDVLEIYFLVIGHYSIQ